MVLLRGYAIIPSDGVDDEGSDSEGDADDGEFESLDYQEITEGWNSAGSPSSRTKQLQIELHILEDVGRRHTNVTKLVSGRFDPLFLQPFWMMTVEVKDSTRQPYFAASAPSYRPREDDGVGKDVCSLFLKACDVHPDYGTLFLDFIQNNELGFSLTHMAENLTRFGDSDLANSATIAHHIRGNICGSVQGKALLVPGLTEYVHRLFPTRAPLYLLQNMHLEDLFSLEKALKEEPWIFGYKTMMHQRFGLRGFQASVKTLNDCNLMQKMSEVMQDALFVYHAALRRFQNKGHTYIPLSELGNKLGVDSCSREIRHLEEALEFLRKEDILCTEELGASGRVLFIPKVKKYEYTIAESIATIMKGTSFISGESVTEQALSGDEDQLRAARLIEHHPVVIMSGKGGCGKTHVICEILKTIDEDEVEDLGNPEEEPEQQTPEECPTKQGSTDKEMNLTEFSEGPILLTAPTGKAASVLEKRTGMSAHTLHHVIYSFYRWYQKSKETEKHKKYPWKFASARLLVCDECSLVSVKTFATLIAILREHSSLQQLVLLGDTNQLPSIEPGNFFDDVYNAMEVHGLSVTLTTNHRSESALIVQNADRISKQRMPEFDPQREFEAINYDSIPMAEAVKRFLEKENPPHKHSQFISFRKKDCQVINELCALHYNKHNLSDRPRGRTSFQIGDKVCIGQNRICFDYDRKEVQLCNGDIFFIHDDETVVEDCTPKSRKRYLTLDSENKMLKIDFRELKNAKIKHAWAKTIHTFQGSETDTVIYVVGESSGYQNWQHVYTAVTRGRSRVYIIHKDQPLLRAIRNNPTRRNTRLKELLCGVLGSPPAPTSTRSRGPAEGPGCVVRIAKYDNVCSVCRKPIRANLDKITPRNEKSLHKKWIHSSCFDTFKVAVAVQATETEMTNQHGQGGDLSSGHRREGTGSNQNPLATPHPLSLESQAGNRYQSLPSTSKKTGAHLTSYMVPSASANLHKGCLKRRGETKQQFQSPGKRPKVTPAERDSKCGVCGKPIRKGDLITPRKGTYPKWVHLSCGN